MAREYPLKYGIILPSLEPPVKKVINKALKRGGVFIDIGAYIGDYTFYAYHLIRKKEGFVIALECDPVNYKELLKRLPNDKNVSAIRAALWILDNEEVAYHVAKRSKEGLSAQGSLYPPKWLQEDGSLSGEMIKVPPIRLDSLVNTIKKDNIQLIKIDIQGAEHPILTDLKLDLTKVNNMIIEVHFPYHSRESKEILAALQRKNFKTIPLYPDKSLNYYYLLAAKTEIPW